jgi:long-chain acyl-CoA synthetase
METEDISGLLLNKAQQFGAKEALCLSGGGVIEKYSYSQLNEASGRLAAEFIERGIQADDPVALLCDSRPRWGVVFFATIRAGGVLVPLDFRLPIDELKKILVQLKPKLLLVSRELETIATELVNSTICDIQVMSVEATEKGSLYPSIDVPARTNSHPCVSRKETDPAIITFTSGTTGSSKGVVTNYGNLLHQVRSLRRVMQNNSQSVCVSILPLYHLFELTAGFLGALYGGGRIAYCNTMLPDEILAAMQEHQPTCMITVPLFLKLLANSIRKEVNCLSKLKRALFTSSFKVAVLLPLTIRRWLFSPIHQRLGGKLEYFVSGGAPLDLATLMFFERIGIPVFQGYGLAETSPVIATNGPSANRPGSVGKPLPGVEIKISDSNGGEILTRGPHVMKGYLGDTELTSALIDDDGWLHTGDIGHIDNEGYLFVSGRKKNTIVLGSGKKVQPEEVEEILFKHPDMQEGCVVGAVADQGLLKGSEEVCAVAVPSEDAIRRCNGDALDLDLIVRNAIEKQAQNLSPCNRPTRIVLSNRPLPRTSSRKIRRHNLREWLAQEAILS